MERKSKNNNRYNLNKIIFQGKILTLQAASDFRTLSTSILKARELMVDVDHVSNPKTMGFPHLS